MSKHLFCTPFMEWAGNFIKLNDTAEDKVQRPAVSILFKHQVVKLQQSGFHDQYSHG